MPAAVKFREERILKIKGSGFYWAEYKWDKGSNLWRYHTSNEGFFAQYDLPTAFSEQDRLLLEIKHSNS